MPLEELYKRTTLSLKRNMSNQLVIVNEPYRTTSYTAKSSKSKSWLNIVNIQNLLQYNTDINAQAELRPGITICPFNNSTCVACYITISTGQTVPFETPNRTWLHPIQPRAPSLNLGSTLSKFKIFYSTIQTSMLKLSCVQASQYVPSTTPHAWLAT